VRSLAVGLALAALTAASCSASDSAGGRVLRVPGDYATPAAALAAAEPGDTVALAAGTYRGPLLVTSPVSIEAAPGAVITAGPDERAVSVSGTDGVRIAGLTTDGGEVGVWVRSADVTIEGNTIRGARHRGVQVTFGTADISGNTIETADAPNTIGVHIANSLSWPATSIRGNRITAGTYGISVNHADAEVSGNVVAGGDHAGISVREMSVATVADNRVEAADRYGIQITDMSSAVLTANSVEGAGEPVKLQYHSHAVVDGAEMP